MALFLLVLLIAVALGIIGVVAKGLLYLLIIGIALFLIDLLVVGFRGGRMRSRRPAR
jgi:hypothetical protein